MLFLMLSIQPKHRASATESAPAARKAWAASDRYRSTKALRTSICIVRIDSAWIPSGRGEALYIRPLIFSDEGHLEVRPSSRFRFLVMTAPVRAYFEGNMAAVSLKVEESYTRSAPGGVSASMTSSTLSGSSGSK